MLFFYGDAKRFRWLWYTLFFGTLPIVMRFYSAFWSTEQNIDYFVLSDIIFLGLMFNASAMSNISSEQDIPSVHMNFFPVTAILSMLLALLYAVGLSQNVNWIVVWLTTVLLVLCSFGLSFFSSNSRSLRRLQKDFTLAEYTSKLDEPLRSAVFDLVERARMNKSNSITEELKRYVDENAKILDVFVHEK